MPGARQEVSGLAETPHLRLGEGPVLVIDAVGHREVGPQRREAKGRLRHHGFDDVEELDEGRADPVHARVHLDVDIGDHPGTRRGRTGCLHGAQSSRAPG